MQVKFTIIFINIIVTLALLLILVNPFWQEMMTGRQDIAQAENDIVESQDILDKTEAIKKLEEEVKKVFQALPSKIDTPELMDSFQRLASNNELTLESIGFSDITEVTEKEEAEGQEVFPSLMLDMSLSGAFYEPEFYKKDFISFLCDLENIARALDVATIDFQSYRYANPDQEQQFTYDLTIKVYYR